MNRKLALMLTLTLLVGTLGLSFKVQRVEASGTIYIRADGSIDPLSAPISTLDNVTYKLTGDISSSSDGIILERNNTVIDGDKHTVKGSGEGNGIDLTGRSGVTVENTAINNFHYGLCLSNTQKAALSRNNITNNDHGIHLDFSSNNLVRGNNVNANNLSGIYLYFSADNDVCGNNVTANPFYGGIYLYSSTNNIICANNVTANKGSGISLQVGCSNNSISENNITNNEGIVSLYYSSSDNKFYHNNFINNTHQVYLNSSVASVWDDGYPYGGNYWSDYNGTDFNSGSYQNETGSDGIGDMPHTIDETNTDNYPLMGTFDSYNVTYYTLPLVPHACNVTVISNSTISDFAAPIWIEHPEAIFLMFNVTGEQGSTGFCRVSFPTVMMNGTYHISVNGTEIPYTLLLCSDADYSYLYFNYTHSTKEVIIIPEFPSFLILPLFFIVTLLAVIVYKRKRG